MLTATRLTDKNVPEIDNVNYLYDLAFPLHERRGYQGRQSIQRCSDYYLYYFTDNNVFIGFIGSWKITDFFYIEHFAISPQLRAQGYGQKVLTLFSKQVAKIILEIDPVIDEQSLNRLNFYKRCGFERNEYKHTHPSYHSHYAPHELEVLSFPAKIDKQTYQIFNEKLSHVVMQQALL